jgi:hypothetical protein
VLNQKQQSHDIMMNISQDTDDDDDDDDMTVIAIDPIRALIHPDQLLDDNQPVTGLPMGGYSNAELPFQLDEHDPI